MGSNGADELMVSGVDKADCSQTTVEIKIKTLDSHTYTMRVDKCVPVPALKDQIAIVTGVLSDQQRLICRGKVLKDDQLLSSYHVEDGHTLHLVVREPLPPPSESSPDHPASHAFGFGHGPNSQARPSVMVGTFNVSDQADGSFPDLSRIVSAVLGSFGAANVGSGSEGADLREHLRTNGPIGLTDSSRLQPGQAGRRGQTDSINVASSLPNVNPLEHVPLVIPDSLATLSQYLSHMRQEFGFGVGGLGNSSQAADSHVAHGAESNAASRRTSGLGGLPTPGYLAEVLSSTRQFLIDQAGECLAQLAVQLVEHPTVTDPVARMSIQSNAMRSGDLFQKLGALLFELGRTTMTLRMGQEPVEAVVNAGPAMFISTSGPNPIMVQPVPFLQGTGFGVTPFGTVQPSPGLAGASLRAGFLPRNVDIRIRAGSSAPTVIANQGEPTDVQQPNGQNSASPGFAHPASQAATATGVSSSSREPEVRVLPIRTVVTAIPSVRRPPSDSSQGPMGMFYPVMARVQQVTNGDLNIAAGSQTSEEQQPSAPMNEGLQSLGSTVRQESSESAEAVPGGDPSQVHGRLDQLLRTLFPGDQVQVGGVRPSVPAAGNTEEMSEGGGVSNEGLFLSNMLHQVMPFISETPGDASSDMADMNRNSRENPDVGTSIHHENDPPTPPDSKRQKRE